MNEDIKEQLKKELKQEMKQEKKKKRIIILIILLLLLIARVITFMVCNSYREVEQNKSKIISQEEFSQYITEIPVTTENWKDYIELENVIEENKDAFGEILSTTTRPHLKVKNNIFGFLVLKMEVNIDLISEPFKRANSNTAIVTINRNDITIHLAGLDNKEVGLNDIKCTNMKGSLYKIDIPEDKWQTDETNGKQYISVDGNIYEKDTYIQQLWLKAQNKLDK